MTPLNETTFEAHIAECLAGSPLYTQRTSAQFDIDRLVDHELLERFLRQQPTVWAKLAARFPGRETDTVVAEMNRRLNRGESLLTLLHKGLPIQGAKVKLVQFLPALDGADGEATRLYGENRFAVVRQMRYSTATADAGNELDLCILLNGVPLLTAELKNEGTGQCYTHGIYQYRHSRNPENRLLRNCLVHFVLDNNYAFMTTCLAGEQTRFLPFNRDSQNPPVEGDYPTAYMWQEIWQADSLLDLVEHFIKRYNDDKGQPVVVFPRFHQLRAVRRLRRLVREEGVGHNYLVQHSAGSGKTKSMAWLAHQLANMTQADRTPVFDSIIMVTDKIVLNRNMADDVVNFETTPGTVKDIRRGSKNLATALNEGHRIIISTVQKFAYALKDIKRDQHRRYAIIVDEAHTAIGNESAKDLVNALSTDDDLRQVGDFHPDDYTDPVDALVAYMQVMRRMMGHISYFAFTATPKDKTYALFGTRDGRAHDLYSMKQAIDEGFILDVTRYYQSYKTMFELIEKDPEADRDQLYEEKKAMRLILKSLDSDAYIMHRKAQMMLDHFMHHTINKIGHRAKAMVVCDSRRAAADYKHILDRLIAEMYGGEIKTLVAFSGEVIDSQGRRCTEANMNDDNVADDAIREKFKDDDYRLLIVAEKFQTGFDQKLLHTMYVDRALGGIQCIQTLSRLNRCCPGKDDTMVIDFRNDKEAVRQAFQRYYTETTLEGEVDTQRVYTLKQDVESWKIFSDEEVRRVVKAMLTHKGLAGIPSLLKQIVTDRVAPLDDKDKDLYRQLVNRYVRQYGFLAQFMDFTDEELEYFYIFCKVLYKYLPYTKETLPVDILERIDLEKLRIQLAFDGQLELEDEDQTLQSARIGEPSQKKPDEERPIAEILDMANSPFAGLLNENDTVIRQIFRDVMADPDVSAAFQAGNSFDILMNIVKEKFDEKMAEQIERYYNFAEVLERERGLSFTMMRKIVEAMAVRAAESKRLPYDEDTLKEKMTERFEPIFAPLGGRVRTIDEVVDQLFFILRQPSTHVLDGVDEQLRNAFNHLFADPDLPAVERTAYFNILVAKYEAFLKKLYYLLHQADVPVNPNTPDKRPALSECIYAFPCLRELRRTSVESEKRFGTRLQGVRDWRNEEAHSAPCATEAEVEAAVTTVTAMYLYVTARTITDLEMVGY